MKTNGTQKNNLKTISFLLVLLFSSFASFSQPDYVFKNQVRVSGTDLQIGTVYRFSNVRPGTDAMVTITDIVKLTLDQLDGPDGFDDAFQPYLLIPGKTKGYAEFRFDFVKAGTTTPKIIAELPVTAIDIDGYEFPDEKLYESDEFKETAVYHVNYNTLGSALKVENSGGWMQVTNTTAVNYPGIDTLQKDVMFSMVYSNVSSVSIRLGATNKSKTSQIRLRSDYFKKFYFPSSTLPASPLNQFKGYTKNNKVQLQWNILPGNLLKDVFIEKAYNPAQFTTIGEVWMNTEAGSNFNNNFNFNDNTSLQTTVYYRLKMIDDKGGVEYSNILVFRYDDNKKQSFKVYPSVINDNATVNITSDKSEQTSLQVVDLNGQVVYQKQILLQQGQNNIAVNGLNGIGHGTYVAALKTGNSTYSQKIIIE